MSRTLTLVLIVAISTAWLEAQGQRKEIAQMNSQERNHAVGKSQIETHSRKHAEAKITVHSSEAKPYDQAESPALAEVQLNETFTGDLDGESPVRALQVLRHDHSANLVSVQRFTGKTRRTRRHLCAPRPGNRRKRQDQGHMVHCSWIGNWGPRWAARHRRLRGAIRKRVHWNAGLLV